MGVFPGGEEERVGVLGGGTPDAFLFLASQRIMTTPYSSGEKFPSSTFVVFSNRLLALIVASVIVFNPLRNGEGRQPMPSLLQFAPCSFSNVLRCGENSLLPCDMLTLTI